MTEFQKLCIEAIEASRQMERAIICPPMTIPLLIATVVIAVPGVLFLFLIH